MTTDRAAAPDARVQIPAVLHYCWFGGKPFPKTEAKCFRTWEKRMRGFTLKRWDESNFDININLYVHQAAEAKKWMYVSDYARLKALYEEGGLYLDCDCKVVRSFLPLLQTRGLGFTGFGGDNREIMAGALAAPKGHPFIKECLDSYAGQSFYRADGSMDTTSVNIRMTRILEKHGFRPDGTMQTAAGMIIYPMTYFCPTSFLPETVPDCVSRDTYCVHMWSDKRLRLERNPLFKIARKARNTIRKNIHAK